MTSDKSLQTLFNEALERSDPVERARFLDEACGADLDLRAQVEKLLRADEDAGGFFSQPLKTATSIAVPVPLAENSGKMIGRYKLLQQIGEGGCGVVYMAEQEEPVRRRVALKIIKLGMDTRQVIARFEAERQALAMMDHPNIARVLDAGATETGRPYFVMELVRGTKITEFCDQKMLSPPERLELFVQVCQAIQHAHQKGIIHRDIKPSNILITTVDGKAVPKVIDFGIAKATNNQRLTDRTLFTAFEQFIGTPAYMSPEQAEMSGVDIDTRTDIYSLGVVLYELLTGRTPFDSERLLRAGIDEIRRTIREKEPPKPSTRLDALPQTDLTTTAQARQTDAPKLLRQVRGDLDWIVMKCLEKERDRRYETANGLSRDIERYLKNEPVVARPPGRWYEFQKTVHRHKFGFAATAAVMLALAVGVLVSTLQAVRATRAEREQGRLREEAQQSAARAEAEAKRAEANAAEAERQRRQTEALADESRYNLYAARIKVAEGQFREGNAGEAQRLLDSVRPATGQTDLRGFDWYHLWELLHSETLSLPHKWHVLAVACSPDGSLLATTGDDPTIHLWDVATGAKRGQLAGHQVRTATVAFSPDGKNLASGGADKTLRLWALDQTNDFRILQTGTNEITKLVFSKDGRFLAWGEGTIPVGYGVASRAYSPYGAPGRVWVWDMFENRLVGNFIAQRHSIRCLAISPDGRKLLSGGDDQIAKLHDLATGGLIAAQTNFSGTLFGGGFSEDGKEVIVAAWSPYRDSGEIVVLDGDRLERKRVLVADAGQILCLATSPDGKKLAGGGVDMIVRVWDRATGAELRTIRGHTEEVAAVTFTPDGKGLATGGWDGRVKTWSIETRPARQEFSTPETLSIAYSPDGKLLVCTWEGVEIRDAVSGKLLRVLPEHRSDGIRGAFSPDGSVLATTDQRGAVHFWNTTTWDHWIGKDGDTKPEIDPGIWLDSHLAFFPDSKTLVVPGNDKVIRFWDVKTGALKETINGYSRWIASVDVTPDGETLVSGSGQICFWDLKTKQMKSSLPEGVVLRLSPDGKQLLSGRLDFLLRDLPNLGVRHTIQGHKSIVYSLAFSPDNRSVATAGADGAVKIWHRLSGQELLTIPSTGGAARSVKFAPDNRALAFSCGLGSGGKVVIIRAATEEKVNANTSAKMPDANLLSKKCDQLGRTGNWKEALAVLDTLIQVEPTNHLHYHRLSPLLVAVGDTEAFHRATHTIKQQFGNDQDRLVAERMAKACLILPSPPPDFVTVGRWVELALTATPKSGASPWNQCLKALTEYRQGNFAAAASWAEKVISNEEATVTIKAQAWMILAMAGWHLKQPDTAHEALMNGALIVEKELPTTDAGDLGWDWNHWIAAQALHREASQLIEGKVPPDPFKRNP